MLQLVYLLLGLAVAAALRLPGSAPKKAQQSAVQPLPVAIYTSEVCIGHNPGSRMGQVLPEQPARLANLIAALRGPWAREFGELLQVREPEADVTEEQLRRIHTGGVRDPVQTLDPAHRLLSVCLQLLRQPHISRNPAHT